MRIRRIAITGAPGTGKTALIHVLEQRGCSCFHEYSRQIIRDSLNRNSDVLPWKDLYAFSELLWEERLNQHRHATAWQIHFYDRTIVDIMAYCEAAGLPVAELWEEYARSHRYDPVVYITPPWADIYVQDNERKETFDQLEDIHDQLLHTYQRLGYKLKEIPRMEVESRANWLMKQL